VSQRTRRMPGPWRFQDGLPDEDGLWVANVSVRHAPPAAQL